MHEWGYRAQTEQGGKPGRASVQLKVHCGGEIAT